MKRKVLAFIIAALFIILVSFLIEKGYLTLEILILSSSIVLITRMYKIEDQIEIKLHAQAVELDSIRLRITEVLTIIQIEQIKNKQQYQEAEVVLKKAKELKSQARMEESDSKAMGIDIKAKREENLSNFLKSNLIDRLSKLYPKVLWSPDHYNLRIYNYDGQGFDLIYYPKSNKINYKGAWMDNGKEFLFKALKSLEKKK